MSYDVHKVFIFGPGLLQNVNWFFLFILKNKVRISIMDFDW